MASETKAPTLSTSINNGLADWQNVGNAFVSDDAWAYVQLNPTNNFSDTLYVYGFHFGIPPGATILGIAATVERSRTGLGSPVTITDRLISLSQISGDPIGNNKADLTTAWPSSDTNKTYGGAADLWGVLWNPGLINATGFGLLIQARTTSSSGDTADCNIDYVELTVTYADVVEVTPWTDYGQVVKRQRRRIVVPFGDTPAGA